MSSFPEDIFTEPENVDVDTPQNLGPLTPMAGIWSGERGTTALSVGVRRARGARRRIARSGPNV